MYLILAGVAAVAVATPDARPAEPRRSMARARRHAKGKIHGNKAMQHRASAGTLRRYGATAARRGLPRRTMAACPRARRASAVQVGQRWTSNYGQSWTYNQIPNDWRDRYDLDANDRYYYRDGYLYQVDPRTRLVEQVLSAILR